MALSLEKIIFAYFFITTFINSNINVGDVKNFYFHIKYVRNLPNINDSQNNGDNESDLVIIKRNNWTIKYRPISNEMIAHAIMNFSYKVGFGYLMASLALCLAKLANILVPDSSLEMFTVTS